MELSLETKNMASLVTFRQLYDNGRKDIYAILSKFIENIIVTSNLYSFGLIEMSEKIRKQYGFVIPDYVVKTSIKRLSYITKENRSYSVNVKQIKKNDFLQQYENVVNNNNKLVDELYKYVTEKKGELSTEQHELLVRDFCSFLLEDSNGNSFSDVISAFILEKVDSREDQQIRLIKEGAILFAGINYNSDVSARSAWTEDIIIYVENEILFHLAGYNGAVFERIAKDLFTLISEMNSKKRRVIQIQYFKEVEKEIDDFFSKAQDIVEGKDIISADNYAMNTIVTGCVTASDVLMKKNSFMRLIAKYGIKKAPEYNYYNKDNYQYNLESSEYIKTYNISDDKIRYIRHLSYVNILRKGEKQTDLKRAQHIVLTETVKILKMAKDICEQGVPYAINVFLLTNRLWYDLNKGFGAKDFPSSFDILIKSQIVLSSMLSQSVSEKYEKIKSEYQNKEDSKEELIEAIIMLREEAKRPEDITAINVDQILNFISEEDITIYQSEKERLSSDLVEKNKEILKMKEALQHNEKEMRNKDTIIFEIIKEKRKMLEREEDRKKKADKNIVKALDRFKKGEIIAGTVYCIIVVIVMLTLSEHDINIFLWILSLTPALIGYIISIIAKKTVNIHIALHFFEEKYEIRATKKQYQLLDIDIDRIDEIKKEIEILENKINKKSEIIIH